MKKIIVTIIMLMVANNIINAQISDPRVITEDERLVNGDTNADVNYYAGKTSVKGNTITYKVIDGKKKYKTKDQFYSLYNENNKIDIYAEPMLNGQLAPSTEDINPYKDDIVRNAVKSCIPEDAMKRLENCSDVIGIQLFVNSKTGKIDEMSFMLRKSSLRSSQGSIFSLPPQTFEKIEKKLKSDVKFTIKEEYRNHSFISLFWNYFIDSL